jgi:mannosyltransferase
MTTLLRAPSAPPVARLRSARRLTPAAVGLVAFLLSEIGNWIPSLWYDEAATVTSATRSWPQLLQEVQNIDAVHLAYYSLMHVVFSLFGYSPFTLRLPSAIAVGLTAALIVVLVRKIADARLALIAGTVYLLLPRVTWMGGEGRSYAFSALLAVLLTLALVTALRSTRRRWWLVYAAVALLSCVFFIYLALVVVAQGVTVLIRSRQRLGAWLSSAVAVGILLLPFVFVVRGEQAQVKWIGPLDSGTLKQIFVGQWFWSSAFVPIIGWSLLAIGAFLLVRRHRNGLAALLLPSLLLPTVLLLLASALYEPLYSPRYVSMCTPFVAIVMAVAIARLRRPWLVLPAIALLAALTVPSVFLHQRAPEAKQQSSWSQVAALLSSERTADPASRTGIVYGPVRYHLTATSRVIEYSYPGAFAGTTDLTLQTAAAQTGSLWETETPLSESLARLNGLDTVYLITSIKQDARPATEATLAAAGWYVSQAWSFRNVNVEQFSDGAASTDSATIG